MTFEPGSLAIKPAAMGPDMSFNQKGAMLSNNAVAHNSIYSSSNTKVDSSFHQKTQATADVNHHASFREGPAVDDESLNRE